MSEIEKYYNGEIIVDFEEETELEKNYNEVAELYSKAVKKKIEYREEIERLNNIINELEEDITFCINNMKNEYSCTDSRTNRELHTMVKILEESLDKIKELKVSDKNEKEN